LKQRLAGLRTRMDALYEDKLDGKITEEFWTRKQAEYSDQDHGIETALSSLSTPLSEDRVLNARRIFKLANKSHRRRKSVTQLQKAVPSDLSEDEKRRLVRSSRRFSNFSAAGRLQ